MSDVNLHMNQIQDLSLVSLTNNFKDESGNLHGGKIEFDGKTYNVSIANGKADITQAQTNIFSKFFNLFKDISHTPTAQMLTERFNTIVEMSNDEALMKELRSMQVAHNNSAMLKSMVEQHPGQQVLEVANYGFSPARNIVKDSNVVKQFSEASGVQINLNKIDNYNECLGIIPLKLQPTMLPGLIDKVRAGSLQVDTSLSMGGKLDPERVGKWKDFLQQNADRVDTPKRLYQLLTSPKTAEQTGKTTGWDAEFAKNPDKALEQFIVKNLQHSDFAKMNESDMKFLAEKLKDYVALYNMPDPAQRDAAIQKYFSDPNNWANPNDPDEMDRLHGTGDYVVDPEGLDEDEIAASYEMQRDVANFKAYALLLQVLMGSVFRQTSKLGLEFFRSQNVPVMFQNADYNGKSLQGRMDAVLKENTWKKGYIQGKASNSPITHSEMRHIERLKKQDANSEWTVIQTGSAHSTGPKLDVSKPDGASV
jgi:hypothetical protein